MLRLSVVIFGARACEQLHGARSRSPNHEEASGQADGEAGPRYPQGLAASRVVTHTHTLKLTVQMSNRPCMGNVSHRAQNTEPWPYEVSQLKLQCKWSVGYSGPSRFNIDVQGKSVGTGMWDGKSYSY